MRIEPEHADAGAPTPSEIFGGLFAHLKPHEFFGFDLFGMHWSISNHVVLMAIAGTLMLLLFAALARRIADGSAAKGKFSNLLESLVIFVRDQMVYESMGRELGRKFAPLFLTQFFFIWFVNLLGFLPLMQLGGTATASINVAAALATTTLVVMLACSMKVSGPLGMWKSLVPHGVPGFMWPMMFVVEVIGFFIKPFALMIRLFANMTGGHLVLLSLFGMIQMFGNIAVFGGVYPMVVFVSLLEMLVAFLQAFIFTFLSIMFVQATVHPEH